MPVPTDPIRVGTWARDEDFAVFPVGSKAKRTLICPDANDRPDLIAGHSYLFKIATDWRAQQLWSEVLAYQIGCLVGVTVPPAFFAFDETRQEAGVAIEFFYGYPGETAPARFVHGIDLIRRFGRPFAADRPHTVSMNVAICRLYRVPDAVAWWAKTLAFDALIGNTDRHTENWGLLVRSQRDSTPMTYSLAPAYDNGTSLAYQHASLAALTKGRTLEKFIENGTHHCGWDRHSDLKTPHIELCARLASFSPVASAAMKSVIRFSEADLRALVLRNVCDGPAVPFSSERAELVTSVVLARRARLVAALGD